MLAVCGRFASFLFCCPFFELRLQLVCQVGSIFENLAAAAVGSLRAEARNAWFVRPRKVEPQFQLRLPREADSPSAPVLCSQTTSGGPARCKHLSSREHDYLYALPDSLTHSKMLGNELGKREGWSISSKLTTLLYYLIHSLLSFLAGVSKDKRG